MLTSIGLWLAPLIASKGSRLLREHPDWFVKDTLTLEPMSSDSETFGGWRDAPWFALDACHPQVLAHLEGLFRYFRDTWHVRYFKLDALFWGALHNGARYSDTCTRIEAYRLGMKAMRRGAPGMLACADVCMLAYADVCMLTYADVC
jgi:alpha-galactosidase